MQFYKHSFIIKYYYFLLWIWYWFIKVIIIKTREQNKTTTNKNSRIVDNWGKKDKETEEKILTLNEIADHFVEAKAGGRAIEVFDQSKTIAETLDNIHRDRFLAAIALELSNNRCAVDRTPFSWA